MPIESKSKEICGRTYTVTMQPAFESLDALELLSKLVGPGIAALSTAGLGGDIEPAARALFAQLGGGALKQLAKELLKGVTVTLPARNGEMAEVKVLEIAGIHFAGKLFEMFQVMAFAVEVGYSDFFDGVRTLLAARAPAAKASESSSPTA